MRVHRVILLVIAIAAGLGQSAAACCVTLRWTAPGDDGLLGTAYRYEIRFSLNPITDTNWEQAGVANWSPIPSAAGTLQEAIVSGLEVGRRYYFIVRTLDYGGNWSECSNVASAIVEQPVCDGTAGNINCDPNDRINLTDITTLVDHLFITYRPLGCPGEANINGDPAGRINLSDLSVLVEYLYGSGRPPAECL